MAHAARRTGLDLRGLTAAAPLKQLSQFCIVLALCHLRGLTAAAPLKRPKDRLPRTHAMKSPRPNSRGPIEAGRWLEPMTLKDFDLRGLTAAAPLKPEGRGDYR